MRLSQGRSQFPLTLKRFHYIPAQWNENHPYFLPEKTVKTELEFVLTVFKIYQKYYVESIQK